MKTCCPAGSLLLRTVLVGSAVLLASAFMPREDGRLSDRSPMVGQQVFSFVLPDAAGNQVGLSDYAEKSAVVLFFIGVDCEASNAYLPVLTDLQDRFGDKLQVIGLHADDGLDAALVTEHALKRNVSFPVLLDGGQRIAEHLGATTTGQAFLLDQQRTVRYHGRIDSRFAVGADRGQPGRRDLEEALIELLDGKRITVARTDAFGSAMEPIDRAERFAGVTYSKEVSRIIQDRCQVCHRPGMIGPFSLLTYDDDADWSDRFRIPAGDPNHEVRSTFEVEEDLLFTSAMPHMHLRGKDYLYQAHYPDGTSEILLSVPNYDFNWQTRYRFAEPPLLPKGTVLEGVAHFDNSTGNPANPDPTESVRWGRQTWHEMMFGWANFERVSDR